MSSLQLTRSFHLHLPLPLTRTYLVGRTLAEDVPHMGARHNFQCATAHPRLERQLQILASPDIEAGVICAQTLEELTVNGEEPSGHRGRVDRLSCALQ